MFPKNKDIAGMFGYVTDEERSQWEASRERNSASVRGTAKEMAKKSAAAALELGSMGVRAQMTGAYNAKASADEPIRSRTTRRIITETEEEIPDKTGILGEDPSLEF